MTAASTDDDVAAAAETLRVSVRTLDTAISDRAELILTGLEALQHRQPAGQIVREVGPPGNDPFHAVVRSCHVATATAGPLAGIRLGVNDGFRSRNPPWSPSPPAGHWPPRSAESLDPRRSPGFTSG